ncbi:MAG: Gfo/Idh/MocA family oxidoreductase, partial [Thermoguttaceae bacterium]|nr:Gfo/Idh/MocA family oxidoreductase [Thermoguttaceae bacterium]
MSNSRKPSVFRPNPLESAAAAGSALAGLSLARGVHAAGSDVVKIALIGCGGRGTGAAVNALSTKANVRLVAMHDAFRDRLDNSLRAIAKQCPGRVDVPEERRFTGLDGYLKAIEAGVDMVLLCGPPGFRPAQFEAAVKAGKHVFMEKPVATDAPGIRRIQAANAEAKRKGLAVAVGHHLRHEVKHKEIIRRIHEGAIGQLQFLRIYFNSSGVWVYQRRPDETEMQYQVRNWYYFTWLGGDHIVEQHVHDIDVANWIMRGHPVSANGMGGRQVRIGKQYGEIFDHHAVEFEYADGTRCFSVCRHIPG